MRTVVVHNGARIPLGKQGENNAVRVVWPGIAEKYAKLYGDGRFELVVVQNDKVYPAVVNVDGADLIWNVLAADVAIAEIGSLELIYYVGDTIAKSQTWETFVEVSKSAEGTTEPPEPAKNWVDVVINTASDAKQSATESAESARQSAESATNAATSATKAENAVGHSPIVGENGNWFVWDFTKSEYVDSGKPASTPPITPETAGKYLTNNGSKAKWGAKVVENIERFDTNELLHVASSYVTAIIKEEGNANSGEMVFPVIAQLDGIIEHGSGFMSYLDAHGDHYVGGFSLVGGAVGVPKLTFSNTILYVTITQDGEDSDGNPIYKSDKTYAEIKAAHEARREVKIAKSGVFGDILPLLGINDVPLCAFFDGADEFATFAAFGVPGSLLPELSSISVGGQAWSGVQVSIYKSGLVEVVSPIVSTPEWPPFLINKLPQQYLSRVSMNASGELSSTTTFDGLVSIYEAYREFADPDGIAALCAEISFSDNSVSSIHRMTSFDGSTFVFQDIGTGGLSTITFTKSNDKDVWTHEVVPLEGDNSFKVTLTSKVSGGYDIDKTFNEVVKAYNDNKYIYALFQNKNDFEFLSLDKFLVPGVEGYALIAFSNEHRYIAFRSSGGSALIYDKSRSSDMTVLRGGDAMPPVPITAADNGKFLRVVDGQWAADAAEGEIWEKIAEIVIPEGADESTALTINKDFDGNPFSLVKARLCAKFPKYTGATTIPNFSFAMLNGKTTGRVTPLAYTAAWPKVSASMITGTVYEIDVSGAQQIEHVIKPGTGGWSDDSSRNYVVYGAPTDSNVTWFGDTLWAKPITSIGGTGMLIYPGCRFVLYGVRA